MRKIILAFCLMLLICRPVAANPVVILGVGQVELGQDIVMTEGHDKKGELNYSFRVKDGAVWRGAILMPINNISSNEFGNMVKTDVLLNRIIEEKISKSNDVLSTEKARRVMVGGRECATTTVKLGMPGAGIVANMDITIISGTDGLKMFGYMCADSDAQYWRPIMQKILASIP
jgi:hypothetical protein